MFVMLCVRAHLGLFHGVIPGTFSYSHTANHHRWNNTVKDVYSTAGYPRNSLWNFCRYNVIWICYATNISSLYYFAEERRWDLFRKTAVATAYYCSILAAIATLFGTPFMLITMVYPLVEGNVMLAVVNWTWHMFLGSEGDDYVNSTTIENGTEFIFSEEYHVVHHAAPGLHHSKYRDLFESQQSKYEIVFQDVNLFELGFTAMFRNYDRLADMVKVTPKTKLMSRDELKAKLQTQLEKCWW
jgi:fatty acid desaturase